MQRLHIEPIAGLSGVTRFSVGRDLPHPQLAIIGAMHGNERCGRLALERLAAELTAGHLALCAGSLLLVHGNPEASRLERRHSERGTDLNRLFNYEFVNDLSAADWTAEHHRALALRPLLESVDALLDLHSTTAPTPPFAIASRVPASELFASALGLDYVTLGWDGPGLLGDRVSLAPLTLRQLPAVAVECGQHDDPAAPELAYRCARAALAYFGLLEEPTPRREQPPERLVIRAAIKRPCESFRFVRPLRGMERLAAGEVLGQGDYLVMSVREPCRVIMPNDRVAVGDDLLYLAETL
jgi:uncharacterized protein